MPEPADRPPLRDQIASAIGGTMILRTSVDEITEAVMQVVHPHLKPQAEAARRMDDPGPLRDRIADRLGQSIAQWWQTPPRLDLAAGAVMPVIEAETAALRQRIEEAERERDEALAAVADEQQRADERSTELLEERDEALDALADAERQAREQVASETYALARKWATNAQAATGITERERRFAVANTLTEHAARIERGEYGTGKA